MFFGHTSYLDLKIGDNDGHGNTELHVSEEGSPSVLEMMLTNVKEKSAQGENKGPCLSKTFEILDSSEEDKMLGGKHSQKKVSILLPMYIFCSRIISFCRMEICETR